MKNILYYDVNPRRIRSIAAALQRRFDISVAGNLLELAALYRDLQPCALLFGLSAKSDEHTARFLRTVHRAIARVNIPCGEDHPRICVFIFHNEEPSDSKRISVPLAPMNLSKTSTLAPPACCELFSIKLPLQHSTLAAMSSALEKHDASGAPRNNDPARLDCRGTSAADSAADVNPHIIGESSKIASLISSIRFHAASTSPVLILGETGTGKELAARALHAWGSRRNGPFIALNCSAIPEGLFESEMFGTERGAYTDASSRIGAIEEANAGTLFLDEIGSMSATLQPRLLRVLEAGEYRRLGSTNAHNSRFRLVSASCLNPIDMAADHRFRKDLLFRIASLVIEIPPLRERLEDIPLLARHFCTRFSKNGCTLDDIALEKLASHNWPGNVRELKAVIARACAARKSDTIGADDIEFLAGISKLSPPSA